MLTPQEIQTALKAVRLESRRDQRKKAVARLSHEAKLVGWSLLGYSPEGKEADSPGFSHIHSRSSQTAQRLSALSESDRIQLFQALLPEMTDEVEAVWQMHARLPYASGYQVRGFRAPHQPTWLVENRHATINMLVNATKEYEQDVAWWARWAIHLRLWHPPISRLCAATIDLGGTVGEDVLRVLQQCADGSDPVGMMGHHVIGGLLGSARPEAWQTVERLFLAARRQDGLRQSILDVVDMAHPQAFRRMVGLINQHDLARFRSVRRAIDVWFGLRLEATQTSNVRKVLTHLEQLLESDEARCKEAAQGDDPQLAYLALCVLAFDDVDVAINLAGTLLADAHPGGRFVAAMFINEAHLPVRVEPLLAHLNDANLAVATLAFQHVRRFRDEAGFAAIAAAIPRFPKQAQTVQSLVWPWEELVVEQQHLIDSLVDVGAKLPLTQLFPYLSDFSANSRGRLAHRLKEEAITDNESKTAVLKLLGDQSSWVRHIAAEALKKMAVTPDVVAQCEGHLSRSVGNLRRVTLQTLLQQEDQHLLASVRRLCAGTVQQQSAGLELLQQAIEAQRSLDACVRLSEELQQTYPKLAETIGSITAQINGDEPAAPTLIDGLGLFEPEQRTPPTPPSANLRPILSSEAAQRCLASLDALIHQHRHTPVRFEAAKHWSSEATESLEQVLANAGWRFPQVNPLLSIEENRARLPLLEVWERWFAKRDHELRDTDGLELVRAWSAQRLTEWDKRENWRVNLSKQLYVPADQRERYAVLTHTILSWLIYLHPTPAVDFLLDATAYSFYFGATLPAGTLPEKHHWRDEKLFCGWMNSARTHSLLLPAQWSVAQSARLWGLLRWFDEPFQPPITAPATGLIQQIKQWWQPHISLTTTDGEGEPAQARHRPTLDDVLYALQQGVASEADLIDLLIGERQENFHALRQVSGRIPDRQAGRFASTPLLQAVVARCRQRIIEVELQRGDLPTAASGAAKNLRYAGGAEVLLRLLQALGKTPFERGWSYDGTTKKAVFSHLIRVTVPAETESPEHVAALMMSAKIPQAKLIETAMFVPQWARHIEAVVQWSNFADAVWWFHAHTKDTQWSVEEDMHAVWTSQIAERTPLSAQDLVDGAVDVQWFWRIYQTIGAQRWTQLEEAAQFCSTGGGYGRAKLFANAMLGQLERDVLVKRIESKRHQDSVRALGLLPLPTSEPQSAPLNTDFVGDLAADATVGGNQRQAELLARYKILQEFERESKQFGAQRQASEKLAVRIAMKNLARTAGYADPVRLQWAMERHAIADFANGAISVDVDEMRVTLSIDELGDPQLEAMKKGKVLKEIPSKYKKQEAIKALIKQHQEIHQQARRMRTALEQAMERGDHFTLAEVQQLLDHPVLRPMLEDLLFVADDVGVLGYPHPTQPALIGLADHVQLLPAEMGLRVAHPSDLYHSQRWSEWQRECFLHERIQPFKQVFRENYIVTPAERETATFSPRYAGQQVNPKQAIALLGQLGWIAHPDEGLHRTFYDCNITVWLDFEGGWLTPFEVEGLTLRYVSFTRRGEWKPLPLIEVPARVFSSAMRDLDLIVSVAHLGGVDPESSMSTVEMRAALVEETARLLKLHNVRVADRHVTVEGQLNCYTIHLGSGVVHRQPGGYVCIVPVDAQQRGRLFLPFVDDDPKSAEILSKMLLLAKDQEIKDPTILQQILPVAV